MTLRFAVVGDPVSGSSSPRMHAAAYTALGLDCTYEALPTRTEDLGAVVARLRSGELAGLNVTIPHKQSVLAHVDRIDPSARTAAAANTLLRASDGAIVAHNTDVPALGSELTQLRPDLSANAWRGARALILGTGATARSAIVALSTILGVNGIVVRGRGLVGAADLERDLLRLVAGTATSLTFEPWDASRAEETTDVIVQATSLGMSGGAPGEPARDVIDWTLVRPTTAVLDVVYASPVTPFLLAARGRMLRGESGHGMLARQGALAFELWLGRPAPFDVMRQSLAA